MRAQVEHARGYLELYTSDQIVSARRRFVAALDICRRAGGEPYLEDLSELILLMIDYGLRDFDAAAVRGREMLRRPAADRGSWSQSIVIATLGAALTGLGQLDEAEEMLGAAVPRVKRATGSANWVFNHVIYLVARQGRIADAARLIGYVDGSRRAQMIVRLPSQRRSYDEALALITSALPADEFDRLRAEGQELIEEQAIALGFPSRAH
jgi:hypothetical protein